MKKKYNTPWCEIIRVSSEDIIRTSPTYNGSDIQIPGETMPLGEIPFE